MAPWWLDLHQATAAGSSDPQLRHGPSTRRADGPHRSPDGGPLLLRPGSGKDDLLCGCVRRLVSCVKGSMREERSATLTSHSLTFSPRAHCCASSTSTCRRSHRSDLLPRTMTITCGEKEERQDEGQKDGAW